MNHDETSYFNPVSHRKPTSKKKSEPDDIQTVNIRFDYSNTYLQNEDLAYQLEDHEDALYRERYKASIDGEERLKKAKQDADERLSLKNAIKNRDPNESSKRISKSADFRRKASQKHLKPVEEVSVPLSSAEDAPHIDHGSTDTSVNGKSDIDEIDSGFSGASVRNVASQSKSAPLNNLTTFLISLQTFKRRDQKKSDDHPERRGSRDDHVNVPTAFGDKSKKRTKSVSIPTPKKQFYPRPSTAHETKARSKNEVHEPVIADSKAAQYGIHVKTDFTRSRRKLEEISRLEQDAKFGYVNKYEERRKRLLASCKDTKSIDERIEHFLKDVDDFKKSSSNENSLEKVLMRARSARISRSNTFW